MSNSRARRNAATLDRGVPEMVELGTTLEPPASAFDPFGDAAPPPAAPSARPPTALPTRRPTRGPTARRARPARGCACSGSTTSARAAPRPARARARPTRTTLAGARARSRRSRGRGGGVRRARRAGRRLGLAALPRGGRPRRARAPRRRPLARRREAPRALVARRAFGGAKAAFQTGGVVRVARALRDRARAARRRRRAPAARGRGDPRAARRSPPRARARTPRTTPRSRRAPTRASAPSRPSPRPFTRRSRRTRTAAAAAAAAAAATATSSSASRGAPPPPRCRSRLARSSRAAAAARDAPRQARARARARGSRLPDGELARRFAVRREAGHRKDAGTAGRTRKGGTPSVRIAACALLVGERPSSYHARVGRGWCASATLSAIGGPSIASTGGSGSARRPGWTRRSAARRSTRSAAGRCRRAPDRRGSCARASPRPPGTGARRSRRPRTCSRAGGAGGPPGLEPSPLFTTTRSTTLPSATSTSCVEKPGVAAVPYAPLERYSGTDGSVHELLFTSHFAVAELGQSACHASLLRPGKPAVMTTGICWSAAPAGGRGSSAGSSAYTPGRARGPRRSRAPLRARAARQPRRARRPC